MYSNDSSNWYENALVVIFEPRMLETHKQKAIRINIMFMKDSYFKFYYRNASDETI